ncbi:hypothetical protein GGR57DRAFT_461815 [Xylariaceae sp. FL1272]|nr:hypothetical protein GGR57DRAFT_461815 [Xylariaceae sp. FL1272]
MLTPSHVKKWQTTQTFPEGVNACSGECLKQSDDSKSPAGKAISEASAAATNEFEEGLLKLAEEHFLSVHPEHNEHWIEVVKYQVFWVTDRASHTTAATPEHLALIAKRGLGDFIVVDFQTYVDIETTRRMGMIAALDKLARKASRHINR